MIKLYKHSAYFSRRNILLRVPAIFIGILGLLSCRREDSSSGERIFELVEPEGLAYGITAYPVDNVALVRDDRGVVAMQLICSHQRCQLKVSNKNALLCPCHGSEFDINGKPLQGPAKDPLKFYEVVAQQGKLAVNLSREVASTWRFRLDSAS